MKRQTVKEINRRLDEYFGFLVKITWGDAHGRHFIEHIENITQLVKIESVGWIIFMDKDVATICSFKAAEYPVEEFEDIKNKYRYYIVIPRKTIWRVRRL